MLSQGLNMPTYSFCFSLPCVLFFEFLMAALKSLSHNCNISVTLVLDSTVFFSHSIWIFFGTMSNFLLKYEHLERYGRKLLIWFKPSAVGVSLWDFSSRRRRAPHCCCHMGVEDWVPHLASADAQGSTLH